MHDIIEMMSSHTSLSYSSVTLVKLIPLSAWLIPAYTASRSLKHGIFYHVIFLNRTDKDLKISLCWSFQALKDSYVFSASLQLSLSQGNTHNKKWGLSKNAQRQQISFCKKKKWALKREAEERKRRKWRKRYSCTVRLFSCWGTSMYPSSPPAV